MKLFDVRTDNSQAYFIEIVNRRLEDEPGNPYLSRFGLVCSDRWWACFGRGELPVEELAGRVTHAGPQVDEFNETEDIIEFDCGDQVIGYDQLGAWAAPIKTGDWVSVTRTIAEWHTQTGPLRCIIDLWAEWLPASADHKHDASTTTAGGARFVSELSISTKSTLEIVVTHKYQY